jgi:O-antigen/teichoic acid export membrane protein
MRSLSRSENGIPRTLRSVTRRLGWAVADQALSSLTNFALGLLAARALSATEFGSFALVFATYLLALGAVRATSSEPFVIRFAAVSHAEWKRGADSATATALLLGVVAGLGCIVASAFVGEHLGKGLLALGVTMPGLLLQDTWRFTFFANRKGIAAFTNDLVWALALAVGVAVLLVSGVASVGWLVLVWGGAGTLAGLFGMFQASVVPVPGRTLQWLHEQKDLIPRYLGEYAVTNVVGQLTAFGVGTIAGLAEVGALRAGQLLLGPLNVLYMGVTMVAVPEGVRVLLESGPRLMRACRRLSVLLASCALVLGTVMWALPDRLGLALLHQNWAGAHRLVLPLAVGMAAVGVVLGAGIGLRALAAARLSLRARLLVAPLSMAGGLGGAALNGAMGAAWGLALAFIAGGVVWWRYFLRGMREREQGEASTEEDEVDKDGLESFRGEVPLA